MNKYAKEAQESANKTGKAYGIFTEKQGGNYYYFTQEIGLNKFIRPVATFKPQN